MSPNREPYAITFYFYDLRGVLICLNLKFYSWIILRWTIGFHSCMKCQCFHHFCIQLVLKFDVYVSKIWSSLFLLSILFTKLAGCWLFFIIVSHFVIIVVSLHCHLHLIRVFRLHCHNQWKSYHFTTLFCFIEFSFIDMCKYQIQ